MRRQLGRLAAVLAVGALLAACQPGEPENTSSPSPSPPVTPLAGSVAVQRFTFVPPEGLEKVTEMDEQVNRNASLEMTGKAAQEKASPPTLDVFVEKGDVGSLKVRTAQIVDLVNLQLEDAEIVTNKKVEVPGATDARLIEVTFTCHGTDGEQEIPCRQVELLVQMPKKPQYGLRYGLPASQYEKAEIDALVKSTRVTGR